MDLDICGSCGARNSPGTQFCVTCGTYLGWDESAPVAVDSSRTPDPQHGSTSTATTTEPVAPAATADPTDGRFLATLDRAEVTLGADAGLVTAHVTNTADIVDGYVVELADGPPWLALAADQLRLLPATEEAVPVRLRVDAPTPVPAQRVDVVLRVRSLSAAPAHQDLALLVIVPIIAAPVRLSVEPQLLRVRDRDRAECTLVVDNKGSNRQLRVRLSGSDPELAVRFSFDPPVLDVEAGFSGRVRVHLAAEQPRPGEEVSRSVTLTAFDGTESTEATLTLQQATSAREEDPPVTLEVEPGLVRVRDSVVGRARLVADNRAGTQWAHLQLRAVDPERVVRVDWDPIQLDVPPGGTGRAEARLQAPLPAAGSEVSRAVTVSAVDGRRTSTATLTFVQLASASPMETLVVRLEPAIIRVRDADSASLHVVLDNRRGGTGLRVRLEGSDPERAVGFHFSAPVVDVGPGQVLPVALQVEAHRPEPGQEANRSIVVTATDGRRSREATGSIVQTASRAAIDLVTVKLEPSVLRLRNRRRGVLSVTLDNRAGAQPLRLSLQGEDPERVVRFTFTPPVVDLAAGQVARAQVRVEGPRATAGQESSHPFAVAATDGRTAVRAEGSLIQSAGDRRPVARVLWTLFGGLAMVLGAFAPWFAGSSRTGVEVDAGFLGDRFGFGLGPVEPFENLLSVGLLIAVLGVVAILGLAGPTGRMSRRSAVLAALVLIALFVALAVAGSGRGLGGGSLLVLAACVAAYVGGALAKR